MSNQILNKLICLRFLNSSNYMSKLNKTCPLISHFKPNYNQNFQLNSFVCLSSTKSISTTANKLNETQEIKAKPINKISQAVFKSSVDDPV